MAGELRLNQVATPTTPASGKDSIFVSTDTPERLKRVDSNGVVYPILETLVMSQTAGYTLTNTGSAVQAFNSSTNGALNVAAGTSYLLDFTYLITNTGTTSHTWAVLFGGTATLTSIGYRALSVSATSNALTAPLQIYATAATALVVTAASVSATENVIISGSGIVRINAAGTFIPQVQPSAATTGTATMLTNSFIRLTPFASNTVGFMGNWT